MLFSIVTVCYNAEDDITKTINSLKMQTCTDYEYIIIDGASTDRTMSVVNDLTKGISNLKVFSEPDNGIYDAMNKGLDQSVGEYIYFLNAGDCFYDNDILMNVSMEILKEKKSLYYGNVRKDDFIEVYPSRISLFYLIFREKMICHQGIFAKKSTFFNNYFDDNYKICADRKWLIECIKNEKSYQYMPNLIISDFKLGGVSNSLNDFQDESLHIAKSYYGFVGKMLVFIKQILGKMLRNKNERRTMF